MAFDLLILDTNLGGAGGEDGAFRLLQRRWPATPLIVASPAASVEQRVRMLNAGADDFLVKPFAVAELVARVNAVLWRCQRPAHDVFTFEDLEVNCVSRGEARRPCDRA